MTWQRSGELIFMVILGGLGTLHGAILGAAAFLLLEEILARFTEHWKLVFGPLLIVIVILARGGLTSLLRRGRDA
jgi:branched-chain amino acid transport system permease protein